MTENQSSNEESSENQEKQAQEVKMIPVATTINEAFYNFLKEYLAFFGSHMTVEDLARQMIYAESCRLHNVLTDLVRNEDDKNNVYVGMLPWSERFPEIARINGTSFEILG